MLNLFYVIRIFMYICILFIDIWYVFPLIFRWWYFQSQRQRADSDNYRSVWRQKYHDLTDENDNVSFGGTCIKKHYRSCITARPIGLAYIQAIMSVSTFTTFLILCIWTCSFTLFSLVCKVNIITYFFSYMLVPFLLLKVKVKYI